MMDWKSKIQTEVEIKQVK